MFLIDFINLYTITFLVVVFLLAYLLRRLFVNEVLTPEGVVEELLPLVDDGRRFADHFRSFLSGKRIEGTGTATGPPLQEGDVVVLNLKAGGYAEDASEDEIFIFNMKIVFLKVTAPTEVKRGDVVSLRGFLVGADYDRGVIMLTIEISELTYVGPPDDRGSNIENGENRITLDY
jgi:hypothetical protein